MTATVEEHKPARRLLAPKKGAAALTAGVLAGLALPTIADAAYWSWNNLIGPAHHNSLCDWYASLAACGWASWYYESGHVYQRDARILVGFENAAHIRGHYYTSVDTDFYYNVSSFSLAGRTGATATYFAGPQSGSLSLYAHTL